MGRWGRLSLGLVVTVAGCSNAGSSDPPVGAATTGLASAVTGCDSRVEMGSLPDWARAGFSGDAQAPHVLGAKGEIVAVLFGHPLRQPRDEESSNKILWVSRFATISPDPIASATLTITATLDGTETRVTREVTGGPGPSIIDLPEAGCWHLELRWSGRTDTMDLVYAGA